MDSDASRFSPLAAELLAFHPSAVVVSTILAATAVQKLSRTVPIVGTGLATPVATGLAHPGGNITGVATMAEDLQLKLFEMMRETLPGVRMVWVMTNPDQRIPAAHARFAIKSRRQGGARRRCGQCQRPC